MLTDSSLNHFLHKLNKKHVHRGSETKKKSSHYYRAQLHVLEKELCIEWPHVGTFQILGNRPKHKSTEYRNIIASKMIPTYFTHGKAVYLVFKVLRLVIYI